METQEDDNYRMPKPTLPAMRLASEGRNLGAVAYCDCCEGLHHQDLVGEFAGDVHAPQCMSGSASPYAATGYKLDFVGEVEDPREALPGAPFRGQAWRRLQTHGRRLQAHTAGALLGRVKSLSVGTVALRTGRFAGRHFDIAFTDWEVVGIARGRDLLSAAAWLFGINPGIVAARLLEAVSGAHFDARTFLEIAAAVDRWRDRGAPRGKGRGA